MAQHADAPVGGSGAAVGSLAGDAPQFSKNPLGAKDPDPIASLIRPLVTPERMAELETILDRALERRRRERIAADWCRDDQEAGR